MYFASRSLWGTGDVLRGISPAVSVDLTVSSERTDSGCDLFLFPTMWKGRDSNDVMPSTTSCDAASRPLGWLARDRWTFSPE